MVKFGSTIIVVTVTMPVIVIWAMIRIAISTGCTPNAVVLVVVEFISIMISIVVLVMIGTTIKRPGDLWHNSPVITMI